MANTLQTIRGKVPSNRVLLAVGGAAAIALGAVQTADTMAAGTDAANAEATQVASENFTPVPVVTGISCSGAAGSKATLSWTSPRPGLWFKVERTGGGSSTWTGETSVPSYGSIPLPYSVGKTTYNVRVYTKYGQNGEVSTGYAQWDIANWSGVTYCTTNGGWNQGTHGVSDWQETTNWTPGVQSRMPKQSPAPASPVNESPRESTPPSNTLTTPSEKPTAPSTEPSETETPETPETETSTPETSTPKPSTPETSETETPAKITVSVGAAGQASGFTVYKDGVESCFADKAPSDNVSVGNGEVVLTTADGAVKKVDPDTCKVS